MYSQLIVLSEAVEGRHEEFNDWYSWVHIRDVMRLSRVVIAVQRFRRAEHPLAPSSARYPQPYLAIYETSDPKRMTDDHRLVFTDEMPISSAYSFNNICEAYYDTIALKGPTPAHAPRADLIVERVESTTASPAFLDWYLETRFAALCKLDHVVSGLVGKSSAHQMYEAGARPELTAIYRSTDLARSLQAWSRDGADIAIDCYTPVIDRLTATSVLAPDPASQEMARAKREAMGDRVHAGAPGFTGFR
jgi:hypothetical protein